MKKWIPFLLVLAMVMAGCSSKADPTPKETTPTTEPTQITEHTEPEIAPVVVQQDMTAVSLPVVEESEVNEDGTVIFTYRGQSMNLVMNDPDVADKIIIDFFTRQDAFRQSAEDVKAAAQSNDTGYAYIYSAIYKPARIDMNVMSLSGTMVNWTGGSHSNQSCIFANYNMLTGDVLTLGSILAHHDQADDLGELVIQAISQVPAEMGIWDGYESNIRDRFAANVSEDQDWFFGLDGLSFSFPPYELAPYASGVITVTIPYEKLVGVIDDAYFPVEQVSSSGTLKAELFSQTDPADFNQIAELVMEEDGTMVMLYTDSNISHVTVTVDWEYTTFATTMLTPGDAIMLQTNLEGHTIMVHYHSGEKEFNRYLQYSDGKIQLLEELPE